MKNLSKSKAMAGNCASCLRFPIALVAGSNPAPCTVLTLCLRWVWRRPLRVLHICRTFDGWPRPGGCPGRRISRTSCGSPRGSRQTRQAARWANTPWEWKRCTPFQAVGWTGRPTVARRMLSSRCAWRAREHDAPPARRPVLRCMAAHPEAGLASSSGSCAHKAERSESLPLPRPAGARLPSRLIENRAPSFRRPLTAPGPGRTGSARRPPAGAPAGAGS